MDDTKSKDFVVWLNERYGKTKEEFGKSMELAKVFSPDGVCYEEEHGAYRLPNVDYDKLFVGARLYYDTKPLDHLRVQFDEIEVTHLYGGVMFFKVLDGECKGEEDFLPNKSFSFWRQVYPKVVMKPANVKMVCDCEKTLFKNWEEGQQ